MDRDTVQFKIQSLMDAMQRSPQVFTGPLAMGLSTLTNVQERTSAALPNCIPDEDDIPDPEQLRTYFLALIVEVSELLQELNWKPWKSPRPIDRAKVTEEFADVLAFLGVVLVYLRRLGISEVDLAVAYVMKTQINVERLNGRVPGYETNKGSTIEDRGSSIPGFYST